MSLGLAGCDSLNSIKEYFTDPSSDAVVESTASQVNVQQVSTSAKVSPAAPAVMKENTLAMVGNWSITTEEFEERLAALKEVVPEYDITNAEARKLVLDELVNQQILVFGAEQSGMSNQKDIKAAVEEFRRTLIVRETARQLTENIAVSDEEAKIFYDENKEALVGPAQWHVREIIFSTKEQAQNVLGEILKGADFAEMAKQHSIGKTASAGGDLGFITQEPFPQMGDALLSMEEGGVSGVFKGPEGHYVVKLDEKKGGQPLSFEEIKEDIIQSQILLKQQQVIFEHLNNLKSKMSVEINEKIL